MLAWAASAAAFTVVVASVLLASACAADSSEDVHSSGRAPLLERTVSSELVPSSGRVALHGSIGSIGLTVSPSHPYRSLSAPGSRAGVGYRLRGAGSASGS